MPKTHGLWNWLTLPSGIVRALRDSPVDPRADPAGPGPARVHVAGVWRQAAAGETQRVSRPLDLPPMPNDELQTLRPVVFIDIQAIYGVYFAGYGLIMPKQNGVEGSSFCCQT